MAVWNISCLCLCFFRIRFCNSPSKWRLYNCGVCETVAATAVVAVDGDDDDVILLKTNRFFVYQKSQPSPPGKKKPKAQSARKGRNETKTEINHQGAREKGKGRRPIGPSNKPPKTDSNRGWNVVFPSGGVRLPVRANHFSPIFPAT